jgi:hypothetical protein
VQEKTEIPRIKACFLFIPTFVSFVRFVVKMNLSRRSALVDRLNPSLRNEDHRHDDYQDARRMPSFALPDIRYKFSTTR